MPLCKKISAHPKHLSLLYSMIDFGEAPTMKQVACANRALESIEKVIDPEDGDAPEYADPELVRNRREWDKMTGKPPNLVWDPDARKTVTLAQDEWEHAQECFNKWCQNKQRAEQTSKRTLLAIGNALEKAEAITVPGS